MVEVLENGKVNEVYNLTLQNELENIEVVNLILEHYNLNMSDHIEFVDDRLGHDFRYSINNEKFLSLTNITATDFKESLRQTILEE